MSPQKNENTAAGDGKIKVSENGPYLVSGNVPLSDQIIGVDPQGQCHGWEQGKSYPAAEGYALCRCGGSGHKPFCDGTHARTGFVGTETAGNEPYLSKAGETTGPGLRLTDVPELCARARFCHRDGGTWKLTEDSSDPTARQKAIEEACECPSGRLIACEEQGNPIEPDFEPPSIGLVEDNQKKAMGPIWVRGGIPVESAGGKAYEVRNRVTLCRCGKSRNKPFCDGSHLK